MPAIGSVHKARIGYGDVTREKSNVECYIGPITALTIVDFLTDFGAFQVATDAITLGTRQTQAWIGDLTVVTNDWPTDKSAQRESKLYVSYMDVVTEEGFSLTVPTVDFSKLNFVPGGGDAVIFSGAGAHADIVAWVTAFEALAVSPRDDTHGVVVTGMRYVGRNS